MQRKLKVKNEKLMSRLRRGGIIAVDADLRRGKGPQRGPFWFYLNQTELHHIGTSSHISPPELDLHDDDDGLAPIPKNPGVPPVDEQLCVIVSLQ